jgi:hypothetical protein
MKISVTDPLTRDSLLVESLSGHASEQLKEEIKPTVPLSEFRVVLSRQSNFANPAESLARLEPILT